jgi:hypothetical protein
MMNGVDRGGFGAWVLVVRGQECMGGACVMKLYAYESHEIEM